MAALCRWGVATTTRCNGTYTCPTGRWSICPTSEDVQTTASNVGMCKGKGQGVRPTCATRAARQGDIVSAVLRHYTHRLLPSASTTATTIHAAGRLQHAHAGTRPTRVRRAQRGDNVHHTNVTNANPGIQAAPSHATHRMHKSATTTTRRQAHSTHHSAHLHIRPLCQ